MLTKEAIEKYFIAQRIEGVLFMIIAAAAIIVAIICFFVLKTPQCKGAAIPCVFIGLILGIVGHTIYLKSNEDRIRNVYAFTMNPAVLKQIEAPRMAIAMKNFTLYKYLNFTVAIIGLAVFFYYRSNAVQSYYKGLGIGFFIMAIVALSVNYFAEKRGRTYNNLLKEFIANPQKKI